MQNQIPKNWQEDNLENLLDILIDHRGITPKKLGGDWSINGIPALSAKNIKTGKIVNEQDIRFVSQKLYEKWMPEKLEDGDILLTSEAPLGELYFLREKEDYVLSQRLFALRTNRKKLNSRYLYYYLQGSIGRQELMRRLSGTAAEGIRQAELRKINVAFPEDVLEQEKIASVISAFDDKIEVNNKIAKTLEEMAQTLFKEWFVKKNNSDTEGKFIKNVAQVTSGKRPTKISSKKESNMIVSVYGANEVMGYTDEPLFDKRIIITGRVGTIGKVFIINEASWPSDNVLVIIPKEEKYAYFLYLFLNRINFPSLNRGSSQPLITQGDLEKYPLPVFDEKIVENFHKIVSPLFDKLLILSQENQKLAALRDLLLPKLMKGEIRV